MLPTTRLHDWVDRAERRGIVWLRDMASEAVCFNCGDPHDLPAPRVAKFGIIRPPFPTVALEFEHHGTQAPICTVVMVRDIGDIDGFWFVVAQKLRSTSEWVAMAPCTGRRLADGTFHFEGFTQQLDLANVWFAWAAHVFQLLRCTNVEALDHKAPEQLNRKRVAKGKCPIFSFKTLHVAVPNVRHESADLGGTHASPRLHLRRGHIRQIGPDRSIWVQSCVVGAKHGIVVKDYALRPRIK